MTKQYIQLRLRINRLMQDHLCKWNASGGSRNCNSFVEEGKVSCTFLYAVLVGFLECCFEGVEALESSIGR